jgi:hypothetical protein
VERFGEFQIFFDRGDFVVETAALFLELLEAVLVSSNALFKADQNIGEFFQGHSPGEACLLYMLACVASQ